MEVGLHFGLILIAILIVCWALSRLIDWWAWRPARRAQRALKEQQLEVWRRDYADALNRVAMEAKAKRERESSTER